MLSQTRCCQRGLAASRLARLLPTPTLLRCQSRTFRSARSCPAASLPLPLSRINDARQQPWTSRAVVALGPARVSDRGLATAVDDYPALTSSSPQPPLPRPYDLQPFDMSSVLVLRDHQNMPKIPRKRSYDSISGDVEELLSMFDACLQVGKLNRAALMLRRLTVDFPQLDRSDIMDLNNQYLRVAVEQMKASPSITKADKIHQWYELHLRAVRPALQQTPETIAYMLKASLLASPADNHQLRRKVTRYMEMAPGDAGLEVLYMTDILTDTDRARITEICPTYNLAMAEPEASAETSVVAEPSLSTQPTKATTSSEELASCPEVLSTPQKGSGLKTLKRTLCLFGEIPAGVDINTLSPDQRREIQARLERDAVEAAIERWREDNQALLKMGLNTSISSASLNSRLYDWQRALEARFKQEFAEFDALEISGESGKGRENVERAAYGPFLQQSTPSRLAALTILSVLTSISSNGVDAGMPIYSLLKNLATVAEEDVRALRRTQAEAKKRKASQSKTPKTSKLLQPKDQAASSNKTQPTAEPTARINSIYSQDADSERWPVSVKYQVGAAMLRALIETAKISVVKEHPETNALVSQAQPAFIHTQQYKKGKKIGVLLANKSLVDMLKREPRGDFLARHLPMVCEPDPWTQFDKGGFIDSPAHLVRVKPGEKDQKIYTEAAISRGHMDQVMKGLDSLGKTAWKINKPVFNVMLEAWNSGEALANIPPLDPKIPVPEEPAASEDPAAKRQWLKALKQAENLKSSLHSVRCFMNFQLEIARAVRDQTIYFPHNVDFRGRAYPVPTYFNHMGADHVRGLMLFAKGKELGDEGLRWLRVHLANVFGFDKASLRDREKFAMDNMANILDSANNPLTGRRWWLQAEDPWQCLATCYELKGAFEAPEPTKFVSHLPVHQDGTCNGLQHYAALGGDSWGARQVNLEPGEKPSDVYSAVADLVTESLAEDAKAGNPMAIALDGKIKRKVVKQTVMTNVYGVTFAGAKKQVQKQLDALYPNIHQQTGLETTTLSSYIAVKIFQALSRMFKGAHEIQSWLGEIGGRVCRALTPEQLNQLALELPDPETDAVTGRKIRTRKDSEGRASPAAKATKSKKSLSSDEILSQFRSTIIWTTPLRMPVVQPYRNTGLRTIQTCLQTLSIKTPEASDPVNRRKQLQAFPPNFIHSLDASHMMLSALECGEMGLTFAAVHDSFWTHAADVTRMGRVLRDAFIRIHSEDVIARLASEFEARYGGSIYLAKIKWDTPAGKAILALRKKTSLSLSHELMMEKKRLELLRSEDPAEVAKGMAMETPGSLVERLSPSADEDVTEKEDVDQFSLGNIPEDEQVKLEKDVKSSAAAVAKAAVTGATAAEGGAEEGESTDISSAPDGGYDAGEDGMTRMEALLGANAFDVMLHPESYPAKKNAGKRKSDDYISVWLPLTFPALPQKGDFDVSRLKGSDYFFS